jgi:hypothetical protein
MIQRGLLQTPRAICGFLGRDRDHGSASQSPYRVERSGQGAAVEGSSARSGRGRRFWETRLHAVESGLGGNRRAAGGRRPERAILPGHDRARQRAVHPWPPDAHARPRDAARVASPVAGPSGRVPAGPGYADRRDVVLPRLGGYARGAYGAHGGHAPAPRLPHTVLAVHAMVAEVEPSAAGGSGRVPPRASHAARAGRRHRPRPDWGPHRRALRCLVAITSAKSTCAAPTRRPRVRPRCGRGAPHQRRLPRVASCPTVVQVVQPRKSGVDRDAGPGCHLRRWVPSLAAARVRAPTRLPRPEDLGYL